MTEANEQMAESNDPANTSNSADVLALQDALTAAETKALESRDLYMRALAEMENLRKRAARDIEQAHKYALEKFAQDLIAAKDSMEMGLQTSSQAAGTEAVLAGVQATLQQLSKAFERAGITEIEPKAQPFNPEFHEAMVSQESAEFPPNTVMQVVQKGYLLNGRLLRPARVIVSR